MEFTTEEKALVAHAQGIIFFSVLSSSRIPVGKGNPIRKPRGKTRSRVRNIFGNSPNPIKLLKSTGSTAL